MSLLKKILSIPKSRKLADIQRLIVVPFVQRIPAKRYEAIQNKKNPYFKLFAIFTQTLIEQLLEKGDVENSTRLASEIVFSRGMLINPPNWQAYMLFVGLIRAHEGKYEQASTWLANGFSVQARALFNRSLTHSYSIEYEQWLIRNKVKITTADGWRSLFNETNGTDERREFLLIYIAVLVNSTGLNKLVAIYLTQYNNSDFSDWKKIIISRRLNNLHKSERVFTPDETWKDSFSDIEQKIVTNVFHRTFLENFQEQLFLEEEKKYLKKSTRFNHFFSDKCLSLRTAFHYLYNADYSLAKNKLERIIEINREYYDSLENRPGPKKLFIAGFGWSGSGAVYDALKSYPKVKDMPGAGDVPYLNDGAESEPMIHHGPGSIFELISSMDSTGKIKDQILKRFFKNYVLLLPSYTYFEYKSIHANQNIIMQIGIDNYYLIICKFAYDYAVAMCSSSKRSSVEAVETFQENIINAMFNDDDIVVFNNSLYPQYSKVLENIKGRSYYVVVNREMSDQYCDQFRSNKFFSYSFPRFYASKYRRLQKYKQCRKNFLNNEKVKCIDVMFEDWIQDPSVRKNITRQIFNDYNPDIESTNFNPEISRKNIGIARDDLSLFDKSCLFLVDKCGLKI